MTEGVYKSIAFEDATADVVDWRRNMVVSHTLPDDLIGGTID